MRIFSKRKLIMLFAADIALVAIYMLVKAILGINHLAFRNIVNYSVYVAMAIITLAIAIQSIILLIRYVRQKDGTPFIRIFSGLGIVAITVIIVIVSLNVFIRGVFGHQPEHVVSCVLAAFIFLAQLAAWLMQGGFSLMVFLFALLASACVLAVCFLYFRQQDQLIEDAITQINRFLSGNTEARIDCDQEGSLFKLFHAVNTLSTTLGAHAVRELRTKRFLRDSISDISHQIKTPLAALEVYNALLQEEQDDSAAVQAFAQKSEQEIERIEDLVQNLLKITRLDAGSIVMEKRAHNAAVLMNDIRLRFEVRAEMEEKTLLLSGLEDVEIFCDRTWMVEAVSNLVKNALDHTEAGAQILITWKKLPAVTQITVKDDGHGIHPEDIHHIFKRFYRSRFSKDTQGIGLGLPLAKAIAEAHDGSIAVDSALGNGSAFVMSFLNLTKV